MTYNHTGKTILVGTETSWATGGSADKSIGLLFADINSGLSKELIESYTAGNLELQNLASGVQEGKLSISGEYQHGKLFEYVFGSVAHAETTGDWVHTFTVSGATSATFESSLDGTTDTSLTYTGMLAESLEISSSLNDTVRCSYEFRGKFPTVGSSASSKSVSSLSPFPHSMVNISISGSAASEVEEASLNITKEIRLSDSLGSNEHQYGAATQFKVEFSARVGFDDNTYHNLAKSSESAGNFVFEVDNGTALGSGKRGFSITVSALTSEVNELLSMGELVYVEVKGTGILSSATSTDNISSDNW